jgi:hypothetical protein
MILKDEKTMETELISIFQRIIQSGIEINVQDNNLKLKMPKGFNDEELMNKIKNNKSDIISFYSKAKSQNIKTIPKAEKKEYYFVQPEIKYSWMFSHLVPIPAPQTCIRAFQDLIDFDLEVFKNSLVQLIKRHEILRTIFPVIDDQISQLILSEKCIDKIFHVQNHRDNINYKEEYKKIALQISRTVFDFCHEPLIKVYVLQKTEKKSDIIIVQDHAITDTISTDILTKELLYIYTCFKKGQNPDLKPVNLQFRDLSEWLKLYYSSPEANLAIEYARKQFRFERIPKNLIDLYSLQSEEYKKKRFRQNRQSPFISKYFSEKSMSQINEDYQVADKLLPYAVSSSYNYCFHIHGDLFDNLVSYSTKIKQTLGAIVLFSISLANYLITDEKEFIFTQTINTRVNEQLEEILGSLVNLLIVKYGLDLQSNSNKSIDKLNQIISKTSNFRQFHYMEFVKRLNLQPQQLSPFLVNNQDFDVKVDVKDLSPSNEISGWSSWAPLITNIRTNANCITIDFCYDSDEFDKSFVEKLFELISKVLNEMIIDEDLSLEKIAGNLKTDTSLANYFISRRITKKI